MTEDLDWQDHAACRGTAPGMFVMDPDQYVLITLCKDICSACPVQVDCTRYAQQYDSTWGVWGQEYYHEGDIIREAELLDIYDRARERKRLAYESKKKKNQ